MTPILFLDIDGVVNSLASSASFDPACCAQLSRIIRDTECKIVLSTTWRHICIPDEDGPAMMTLSGFRYLLKTHGVIGAEIIGHTEPDTGAEVSRGQQCRNWLRKNPCSVFCAVDDDPDGFDECRIPLVQTNGDVGLTEADADKVIEILNPPRAAR